MTTEADDNITFLFFHYGKIPRHLENAIESARIFNPSSEILLITEGIKDVEPLARFRVRQFQMSDFESGQIDEFRRSYRHLSGFGEKYERFCFERWFVAEAVRRRNPERVFVMVDSDVAVFGRASELIGYLPDTAISIAGGCPHFTFITGSMEGFLNFIIGNYKDPAKLRKLQSFHENGMDGAPPTNLSDMTFLHLHMRDSDGIKNYQKDTASGFVDTNIHLHEGFDHLELRRRPRKMIFWRLEDGRAIPFFKRGGRFVKAFILHFQGPGKRVFDRFNSLDGPPSRLRIWWWNQIFQRRWLANLM
jgi:hypothetical protein